MLSNNSAFNFVMKELSKFHYYSFLEIVGFVNFVKKYNQIYAISTMDRGNY